MIRRKRVVEALYSPWPRSGSPELDSLSEVFRSLATIEEPVFVVVRPEHRASSALITQLQFEIVFDDPELSLLRVDPAICLKLADNIY